MGYGVARAGWTGRMPWRMRGCEQELEQSACLPLRMLRNQQLLKQSLSLAISTGQTGELGRPRDEGNCITKRYRVMEAVLP